ncbi:MAG: hydroxymethylpyrimidine/phosphomethylpyrimidine kinase [Pseudomonadota bacterium]
MNQQSEDFLTPVVMVFAGNDPTGGAGIQADIEALASMGCHAAPIITALTVQDTRDVMRIQPMDLSIIIEQARAVFEDMPVDAIKIGLLGSVEAVEAVHSILRDYHDVPIILDPILVAGGGSSLANDEIQDAMISLLLPFTTLLTPNSLEARALAPEADSLEACAQEIFEMGVQHLLITGTHERTPKVINHLYSDKRLVEAYTFERLPHSYHGSGCTLASAITGLLAQDMDLQTAVSEAQQYTYATLKSGMRLGMGQHIPNRLFWGVETQSSEEDDVAGV